MVDGTISHERNDILEQWRFKNSKLFESQIMEVDDNFIDNLERLNSEMERKLKGFSIQHEGVFQSFLCTFISIVFQKVIFRSMCLVE
jgi:hypothetical protein